MTARDLAIRCQVESRDERLLELAINRLGVSARAYTRILKVARTITDLDGGESDRGASRERGYPVPLPRPRRPLVDKAPNFAAARVTWRLLNYSQYWYS